MDGFWQYGFISQTTSNSVKQIDYKLLLTMKEQDNKDILCSALH